ncbi:hypothetical protein [Ruminococcus sp.]|uniref:hypothetical protein n=1 Tax=Ruminococcus sp. TaxID=41978 RepID=UPI0025D67CE1|nr:hypothetical protein [Ruminococcus sp.]
MQINDKNKSITYNGEDMINVIKEIDEILISLHDMGSYYADKLPEKRQEYEHETTEFIDEGRVCERLAAIRKTLSEGFDLSLGADDMDDIERACADTVYWQKPAE